jgi:hypothetical protein
MQYPCHLAGTAAVACMRGDDAIGGHLARRNGGYIFDNLFCEWGLHVFFLLYNNFPGRQDLIGGNMKSCSIVFPMVRYYHFINPLYLARLIINFNQ